MVSRRPNYLHHDDAIEINAGRPSVTLRVTNTGDRPVQIGSHFHFFEVNRAILFDRQQAWGMHLDIPAGMGVRFEPGETKQVTLVEFGGGRFLYGFNGLVNGGLDAPQTKARALRLLVEQGFADGEPPTKKAPAKSAAATKPKSPAKSVKKEEKS